MSRKNWITRSVYFPADINDWLEKHMPENQKMSVFIGDIIRAEMARVARREKRGATCKKKTDQL